MDKKEQLASLLASLSPEQMEEFEALLHKSSVTSRNTKKKKRRGKGKRKKRESAKAKEQRVEREQPMEDSPPSPYRRILKRPPSYSLRKRGARRGLTLR